MLWILGILSLGLAGLTCFLLNRLIKTRNETKQLYWQAEHDPITKLPNRISFEKKAEKLIEKAGSEFSSHAMLYIGLDQFRLINETFGLKIADELLCNLSQEINIELHAKDVLARLGSDKLGILLLDCELDPAAKKALDLFDKIKHHQFSKLGHSFDIGASIGVVGITSAMQSVDKLMRLGDLACYTAKDAGRYRVHTCRDNEEALYLRKDEMFWVSGILTALKENRIVLYSQKIGSVGTDSGSMHHEILVRLIDSDGEVIAPDMFIPAAERYNLMTQLDLAIIDRAFSALNNHYFHDLGRDGFISINLSGNSLSEPDLLAKVRQLMIKHAVDPRQICFEITETAAVANKELVKEFMKELKSQSVKFALDDFGTGLSSFTYLKDFPVDYLKIDGSFIKDMVTDSVDRKLVDAINRMAHSMGLKTVAEYVESKEILALLDDMSIDYAQGYYIQQPVKIETDFKSVA